MMRRSGGGRPPSGPKKTGEPDLELVSFGKFTFSLPRVICNVGRRSGPSRTGWSSGTTASAA